MSALSSVAARSTSCRSTKRGQAMNAEYREQLGQLSRRMLLASVGTAAVGSAMRRVVAAETRSRHPFAIGEDRFSRLFPALRPFAQPSRKVNQAMLELGRPGGILDAMDDLTAGPVQLITNLDLSLNNPNSPLETAGATFVGQFMDHDLTFDLTSRLGRPAKPRNSPNSRTPAFDLDLVYGGGPAEDPELYQPGDRRAAKFDVGHGGRFEDLPRDPGTGTAIIADPRNDENLMLGGLHAAFLLFHNAVRGPTTRGPRPKEFRGHLRSGPAAHHLALPMDDFARVPAAVHRPARGRRHPPQRPQVLSTPCRCHPRRVPGRGLPLRPFPGPPDLPLILAGGANNAPFFGMIFDPAQEGSSDPDDLRGGARAPRRFVGWQTFFDFGGTLSADVRPNKLIDTKISTPLFHLPIRTIAGSETGVTALPQRNLLRHVTWGLPSGQSGASPLAPGSWADPRGPSSRQRPRPSRSEWSGPPPRPTARRLLGPRIKKFITDE